MNRTRLIVSLVAVVALLLWSGTNAAAWIPLAGPRTPGRSPQKKIAPLRVRGKVQESKLIKRVEPVYPEIAKRARVTGLVMLELRVNEEGVVENVWVIHGHPLFDQAAIDAVRQWKYSPTVLNGVPVPVISTVTVPFNPNGTSPSPKFVTQKKAPVTASAVVDPAGDLMDSEGKTVPIENLQHGRPVIQVPPGSEVPFTTLEQTLRNLQAQGIQNFRLMAPGYRFIAGKLFYLTRSLPMPKNHRSNMGIFPDVQPPILEIDLESLGAMLEASGRMPLPAKGPLMVMYTVCVDERGAIVNVEPPSGSYRDVTGVVTAISQARVLSPGRRNGLPVPTALLISIPVGKHVE